MTFPALSPQERAALEAALRDVETAAWQRSWTRLQAARRELFALTGVRLTGKLTAALRDEDRRSER